MINKKEFIKNNVYSLGGKVVNLVLNIGSMAILARLLTPKDFGVFAIIMGVQALFQPILDMGLGPVYIKKEKITNDFKNSFFTINLFLGILNILFLVISIYFLNKLYNMNLTWLIICFSFSILFTSLSLIYMFEFTRSKNFKVIFFSNLIANFLSIIIAIIFALFRFGVWALIAKAVFYSLFLLLIYIFYKGFDFKVVKFSIIRKYVKEIKFGILIFINRIINGVSNSIDKIILAKFYSPSVVGNYNNAKQLLMLSDNVIRTSMTSVVFSYLERLDKNLKKKYYLNMYGIVFIISSLLPILFFFFGKKIVLLLLGNQWIEASNYVKPLSIFVIGMILRGILIQISMSEYLMRYITYVNFGFLLIMIFIYLFFVENIMYLLYYLSIFSLLYWLIMLLIIICILKKRRNYESNF